ncbi:coilin-like [Liolophura sinensis]|uniref:coilin-like n=1 Tax=Liolophura sinensis TaxID=3198878 RepID=UPI003159560D
MASSQKHVRIRVRFSSDCHEPSWLFVNKHTTKTISDLAEVIRDKFPNTNSFCFKLTLANFLLPPWESIDVLQNGDVVRVQSDDDQCSKASLQQKSAEAGHHSQTWISCPDPTSQTSDQPVTETKREKKTKKKRHKEDSTERLSKDEASGLEDQDGVSTCKKQKKAHKARKNIEQVQGNSGKKNDVLEKASNNRGITSETAKCDDGRGNASVDFHLEVGKTDPVKIKKNHSDVVDNQGHKSTEPLKQPCDEQNGTLDKSSPSSEKDNQKKNKRRRRKRKKTLESPVVDVSVGCTVISQVTPPAKWKKNQKVLNTHKHFGDSEEEDDQSQSQSENNQDEGVRGDNSEDEMVINDNGVSMRESQYCSYTEGIYGSNEETDSSIHQANTKWHGSRNNISVRETTLTNGTSVFTRKRKWKFPELTKDQQLATTATNKSVIIQNPAEEKINVLNGCTDLIPVVKLYEEFPLLTGPPRSGDKIAYKILELTTDYCPEVSAYKEGTVINYDPSSEMVSLKLVLNEDEPTEILPRKFDVHIEDEDLHLTNVEEVTNEVLLKWKLLLQPRLLG